MSYSLLLSESRPNDPSLDEAWSQLKQRLSSGDSDSWNAVFLLLYPVAFQSSRVILGGRFESECEDVAMETLAEILNQVGNANSAQALKPLTAAIARNKSKDLLRRSLSLKRGGTNVQSLDSMIESCGEGAIALPQADFLDVLTISEVRELLTELSKELKKEYRLVLKDHFFDHLSHSEIASKRKIAVGSVGKYLQRGIECLRVSVDRNPKLKKELRDALSDNNTVQVLLPLISATQMNLNNPQDYVRASRIQLSDADKEQRMAQWTDEEILQSAPDELPEPRCMEAHQRARMLQELNAKFPNAVEAWTLRKHQEAASGANYWRKHRIQEVLGAFSILLILVVLIAALIFGIVHLFANSR